MSRQSPFVSIGLPVYNGKRFLGAALDSILGQSFRDFEIVLSDNASDDGTREVCERYAGTDARIRYLRNETNVGAGANFNRTFESARGRYFKWMAYDDVLAPDFLRRCVAALDADPSAVLAHPRVEIIDEHGDKLKDYRVSLRTDVDSAHRRFAEIVLSRHNCYQVFGLIRSNALVRTRLIENYTGSDRNLLAELALIGRFLEIPEVLACYRHHPDRSMKKYPERHDRNAWFDPALKGKLSFPAWRRGAEYLKSPGRVRVPVTNRWMCYLSMGRWLLIRSSEGPRNLRLLADDLGWAARRALTRPGSGS